jgi:hypothetical protein
LALVVVGHATLVTAVDLHVGGVQINRDRLAQRSGSATSPIPVSTARHCPSVNRRASPAAVVEHNPGTAASTCPAVSPR